MRLQIRNLKAVAVKHIERNAYEVMQTFIYAVSSIIDIAQHSLSST